MPDTRASRLRTWTLYEQHVSLETMCQRHHERTLYPRDELMFRLLRRAHHVVHFDLFVESILRLDATFGLGTIIEDPENE